MIAERFGWTFQDILALDVDQFEAVCRFVSGRPVPYVTVVEPTSKRR